MRRAGWLLVALLLAPAAPAHASGETLTASPTRGAPGAAVRLDYETNYGPGGCQPHQVVQLFFDASPLASAAMDPSRCGAARTVHVPSAGCGRHLFRAAWRTGQDPTLYGEATAAFVVLCTAPRPTRPAPRPQVGTPTSRIVTAPPTAPPPVRPLPRTTAPLAVPAVTPTASPQAAEKDDSGTSWPLWSLFVIGLGGAGLLAWRRLRS